MYQACLVLLDYFHEVRLIPKPFRACHIVRQTHPTKYTRSSLGHTVNEVSTVQVSCNITD